LGEGSGCHKGLNWAKGRAVTKACIGRRIGLSQRPVLGEGSGCHKGLYWAKDRAGTKAVMGENRPVTMSLLSEGSSCHKDYWAKDRLVKVVLDAGSACHRRLYWVKERRIPKAARENAKGKKKCNVLQSNDSSYS
jgi:hypothetical protein